MTKGLGGLSLARCHRVLGVVCALAHVACAGPEVAMPRIGNRQASIQGGELDKDTQNVFAIYNFPRKSLCSAALIAPNVLLTARHCVASFGDKFVTCGATRFGATDSAAAFVATTAAVVDSSNLGEYRVQAVMVPEGGADDICGGDVAVLVLADNVDRDVIAPLTPRLDEAMIAGEVYAAVGYGAVDKNGAESGTRRRRDGLQLNCVGKGCELEEVADTEWLGETGVCQGDSGGPALDTQGRVVGVVSRGSVDCGYPIYGDTNAFADFIKDSVLRASGMGLYEAPDWTAGSAVDPGFTMPIGQLCSKDADCPTGICVDEGEGRACTRRCDPDNPCPLDYTCQETEGRNLCIADMPQAPPVFQRPPRPSSCAWSSAQGSRNPRPWSQAMLFLACVALWRRQRE